MTEKTHFERIVGGTPEEKENASNRLQVAFKLKSEQFAEYELEKTPEDLEILNMAVANVDKMVAQYGGDPKPLPLDNIYILQPGSILKMTDGKLDVGIHQPLVQKIGVEKGNSKLLFTSTIAHELFHLKSFKSARLVNSGEDLHLYRSGITMVDIKDPNKRLGEEKEYFSMLEEAIVAECTRKLLNEVSKESMLIEESEAVRKLKDWVMGFRQNNEWDEELLKKFNDEVKYIANPQDKVSEILSSSDDEEKRRAYAAGMFDSLRNKDEEVEFVERYHERKMLYDILDKLIANSDGKFKNRDEMFNEFAKANFSGNYLPLAKIVEGILGKGSFRKLAEEFSEEPK